MEVLKRKHSEEEQGGNPKKRKQANSIAFDTPVPSTSWSTPWSDLELQDLIPRASDSEESEQLFEDLDQYFETEKRWVAKISENLAALINRALHENPKENKIKPTLKRYNLPANTDHLQVPKVDLQLWRVIDHTTRYVDLQIQQNMHTLTRCVGPAVKMLGIFMNPSAKNICIKHCSFSFITLLIMPCLFKRDWYGLIGMLLSQDVIWSLPPSAIHRLRDRYQATW